VLEKYLREGVDYVEFSVGWSDMVEKPWVAKEVVLAIFHLLSWEWNSQLDSLVALAALLLGSCCLWTTPSI
jgi:hypothetical protein